MILMKTTGSLKRKIKKYIEIRIYFSWFTAGLAKLELQEKRVNLMLTEMGASLDINNKLLVNTWL